MSIDEDLTEAMAALEDCAQTEGLGGLRKTYRNTHMRSVKLGCIVEAIRLIEEAKPGIDEGAAVDAAMAFLRMPPEKEQRT